MELDKYLHSMKPELSIHTRRVYSSQLMRMVKKLNMLIDTLSDFDKYKNEIIQYLDSIPDNSRKSTCSAYLAIGATNDVNTMIRSRYHSKYLLVSHEHIIPWLHLIEQYRTYYKQCIKQFFLKIPNLTNEQYYKVQTYVYLSCNILAPPRPNSFWINLTKNDINLIGGDKHLIAIINKWLQVQNYNDYLFTNFIDRSIPISEIQLANYHHYIPPAYKISYSIDTLINSYNLYKKDNTDNSLVVEEDIEVKKKDRLRKYDYVHPQSISIINQPIQVFFD